ncbi:MAG: hypothetical protein M3439_07390 [Chloroflexota bacterium]|nr:hypothetical protein [Chloroflexota bacterium]
MSEGVRSPFERPLIALANFSKGMEFVRKGAQHDLADPIVRAAPSMFRDLDGRPVTPDEGPAPRPPVA